MTNIAVISFNSGEVTPEVDARKDIPKYTGACRTLQNMIPDIYGNATRRPGTELIQVSEGAACYYKPIIPDPNKIGISTVEEWFAMNDDLTGDYELLNNLDFSGITYEMIGKGNVVGDIFRGSLDGRYFTISNINIATGDSVGYGVFANIANATIENLTATNVIIDASDASTSLGLLVGVATTNFVRPDDGDVFIINCRATGSITRPDVAGDLQNTGGIVGAAYASESGANIRRTTITRCSTNVTITSLTGLTSSLTNGGLVGGSTAIIITDSYAEGSLITDPAEKNRGGGLVGFSENKTASPKNTTITNCYSAVTFSGGEAGNEVGGFVNKDFDFLGGGIFTTYSDCFWDDDVAPTGFNDTYNLGDVANVTGKTTAQMYTETTFTNWDFDTVWEIDGGSDYPRHQWQRLADIKRICYPL